AFNSQEATLKAAGVRIFGPNATVAQDLEPEYIAVSEDGTTAYVTLQENNALAIVDIASATVNEIKPLGYKDHGNPNNAFDASDRDVDGTSSGGGKINIQTWKVKGMYQPDAIAAYTVGGQNFYVTANEGDSRDYSGFSEEVRVGAGTYLLDPNRFPDATNLKLAQNLGRLTVTNATGDTDGDGDIDEIYVYGARSFAIWDENGNLVYDSGDDFERILATQTPTNFNSNGTPTTFDTRSDNKGPEPEAVAITTINGKKYAFIGLERAGGFMVYNITDPQEPYFVLYVPAYTGDVAPEDIKIIEAADSPNGQTLIVVANEVSNTITTYTVSPLECSDNVELMANPHGGSNSFNYVNPAWEIDTQNSTANGMTLINADQSNATLDLSGLTSGGIVRLSYLIDDLNDCVEIFSFYIGVEACPTSLINGRITWEHDGSGVNNATVEVTGDASGMDNTDIDGYYSVSVSDTGSICVTPSKPHANLAELTNGVDASDVLRIQQHVNNTMPFASPYKRIAADINGNNLISSQDASILSQALKGNNAAINLFKKSWRFVPADYVFPNPNQPWGFPEKIDTSIADQDLDNIDFIGIKIGNVNGSAINPALKSDRILRYTAQDQYLRAGQTVQVDVRAANFADLAALQFGLNFDPEVLAFEGVVTSPNSPIQSSDFGLDHASKGEIRAVWTSLTPQSAGYRTPLYRLRFRALQSGALLSQALRLDEQTLRPAAYSIEHTAYPVEWVYLPVSAIERESDDDMPTLQTLAPRPTPFTHALVAGFELPEACEAQVRLLDLQGRTVAEQKATFAEGYNEVAFQNLSALPAGVYLCELTSEFGLKTVRVVKAN
ncbi:MAG: choice-of-anchor I family protein, partial [Saprospiraceae bacterium]